MSQFGETVAADVAAPKQDPVESTTISTLKPAIAEETSGTTSASTASRAVEIYKPSEKSDNPVPDHDETAFEMTTGHAKIYQSILTAKSRKLTEGGPLLTKELRRKQEAEKRAKIERCEVRIRFPDQTQLLSMFKASETIGDIMTFVRFSLVDPMLPFYFFITPPRRELKDASKTLVEDLKFGSREIVYFAWDTKAIAELQGDSFVPPAQPLREEVLKQARDIGTIKTFDSEPPKDEEEEGKGKEKAKLIGTGSGRTLGGGSAGGSKLTKAPAWMKLGRK
ncbi:hypothetical protein V1512DRAFT_257334 [Lipomyces arxii]|uniref:uncharacterized protein n=1 Tax=Lipomyces arxii TaxID=56418 RepID=UPI0034CE945B